jgi:hypothetical protein
VQIRNFDWHASLKDFKEAGTVEALWQVLQPFVPGCGMASGSISQSAAREHQNGATISKAQHCAECILCVQSGYPIGAAAVRSHCCAGASAGLAETPWAGGATVQWRQQQQGVLRYNCADSLDRTNAASYFVAVQVCSSVLGLLAS